MDKPQHAALIEYMKRAAFYPHSVQSPIREIQTHISHVFLTGERAYKIKKPVHFAFLDFSSLEQRHQDCLDELRLNQRFAPELYLEVLPIYRNEDGTFSLGEGTRLVEYVVVMKEFPQNLIASQLLVAGLLEVAQLARFGTHLATLHFSAPLSPEGAGCLETIRQVAEGNDRDTRPFIGELLSQKQWSLLSSATQNIFASLGSLFDERVKRGHIRECHGDLHLNNIWLDGEELRAFDCIEFNASFRHIDVIYDAAFLMMDLVSRQRVDLAYSFFNAWIEESGDYRGALLLPLYCSMRAYIRGKIYALTTLDPAVNQQASHQAADKARYFFELAGDYLKQKKAIVWVVAGLSGSGKSTVARYLAQKVGALHLRSDVIRKQIAGLPLMQKAPEQLYSETNKRQTYQHMSDLGLALANTGQTVILDATFSNQAERVALIELANSKQLELRFIVCEAPIPIMKQRLMARKHDPSDAGPAQLEQQCLTADAFEEPLFWHLDTSLEWSQALDHQLGQN